MCVLKYSAQLTADEISRKAMIVNTAQSAAEAAQLKKAGKAFFEVPILLAPSPSAKPAVKDTFRLFNIYFVYGDSYPADDTVGWVIDVERAGRYRVVLDYSCHDASAGNRIVAELSAELGGSTGDRLEGTVAGTGGWADYRDWALGEIELPAGRLRLELHGSAPQNGALLDLRTVRLEPIDRSENGS